MRGNDEGDGKDGSEYRPWLLSLFNGTGTVPFLGKSSVWINVIGFASVRTGSGSFAKQKNSTPDTVVKLGLLGLRRHRRLHETVTDPGLG